MRLDVLVGVAPERFVEGTDGVTLVNPDGARDRGKRNMAQPERDDLLLASGDVDSGLRRVRVAAATPLRRFKRCLIHGGAGAHFYDGVTRN
jgi:hypothetical protein